MHWNINKYIIQMAMERERESEMYIYIYTKAYWRERGFYEKKAVTFGMVWDPKILLEGAGGAGILCASPLGRPCFSHKCCLLIFASCMFAMEFVLHSCVAK